MVGGLPVIRTLPFEYKAPFSPCDVIEEYTRPARFREKGVLVTRPALSDPELVSFDQVGTLEAFNSDGLRSLLVTLPDIPDMNEKTLRYPGHIALIAALRDSGFFDQEPVVTGKGTFVPFEVTSEILKKAWKLEPGEKEFTIMRIVLETHDNNESKKITYDLFDTYDPATGLSSMARTTGFTCTAAARMILEGLFSEKGLFPPERIVPTENHFRFILNHLAERKIRLQMTEH